MNQEKISNLIIQLRKKKDFTQQDLADILGVSYQAVSKWERGENLPDTLLLTKLADTLDITVDELLRGETIEKPVDKVTKKNRYKKKEATVLTISVVLYFISLIVVMLFPSKYEDIGNAIFLIIASIATAIIVFFYVSTSEESSKKDEIIKLTPEDERIQTIIYFSAFIIYMLIGFLCDLWHPGWIVFLIAYVVALIFKVDN